MSLLPPNTTTEPVTVQRLTSHTANSFNSVIQRFRILVPQANLQALGSSTSAAGIEDAIKATGTTTDFVLFNEFNHGRWIRHFPALSAESASTISSSIALPTDAAAPPPQSASQSVKDAVHGGRGLFRFIFGNPLIAISMIREDVEAGLHVPIECCFVEQDDGGTKMIMMMPGGLVAGHEGGRENERLREAVGGLEGKVLNLVAQVMK